MLVAVFSNLPRNLNSPNCAYGAIAERMSRGEAARGRASLLVMGAEKRLCPDHRGVRMPTCAQRVGKRRVGVPHSSFVDAARECGRLVSVRARRC